MYRSQSGTIVTNYIPIKNGDTVYIEGLNIGSENASLYASNNGGSGFAGVPSTHTKMKDVSLTSTCGQVTINGTDVNYIRFTGTLTGSLDDVIIKVNEPIS